MDNPGLETKHMAGILEGLRVIQMGHVASVPTAGSMMADWGADVIKLEPFDGEGARHSVKSYGASREVDLKATW